MSHLVQFEYDEKQNIIGVTDIKGKRFNPNTYTDINDRATAYRYIANGMNYILESLDDLQIPVEKIRFYTPASDLSKSYERVLPKTQKNLFKLPTKESTELDFIIEDVYDYFQSKQVVAKAVQKANPVSKAVINPKPVKDEKTFTLSQSNLRSKNLNDISIRESEELAGLNPREDEFIKALEGFTAYKDSLHPKQVVIGHSNKRPLSHNKLKETPGERKLELNKLRWMSQYGKMAKEAKRFESIVKTDAYNEAQKSRTEPPGQVYKPPFQKIGTRQGEDDERVWIQSYVRLDGGLKPRSTKSADQTKANALAKFMSG